MVSVIEFASIWPDLHAFDYDMHFVCIIFKSENILKDLSAHKILLDLPFRLLMYFDKIQI